MDPVFVFDIDGTIKPAIGSIPRRTKQTIINLTSRYVVILATGRTYEEARPIAKKLSISYLVCSGGKEVYVDDQCIYSSLMRMNELPNRYLLVSPYGHYSNISRHWTRLLSCFASLFSKEDSIHGFLSHFQDAKALTEDADVPVYKIYGFGKAPKNYRHIFGNLYRYEYECKDEGLLFLKSWLHIQGHWIGFGNSENDMLMFQIMDEAYLVGRRHKHLKPLVKKCVGFHNGIARVCAKYL